MTVNHESIFKIIFSTIKSPFRLRNIISKKYSVISIQSAFQVVLYVGFALKMILQFDPRYLKKNRFQMKHKNNSHPEGAFSKFGLNPSTNIVVQIEDMTVI